MRWLANEILLGPIVLETERATVEECAHGGEEKRVNPNAASSRGGGGFTEDGTAAAAPRPHSRRERPILSRSRGRISRFRRRRCGGGPGQSPGSRFAGITTFPALLFDAATRTVKPTPNLETLRLASETLARFGHKGIEINAPGTTSSVTLEALADAGATQVEPGHGLTGTTPLHVTSDLPETPAVVYLTEVSHLSGGEAFCFGGGLYIDPVFPNYQVRAIVAREPKTDERGASRRRDTLARHH